MDDSTTFNDDPADQARIWEDLGARKIHVVDLDGSVDGKAVNLPVIKKILKTVKAPIQIGGGIRNEQTLAMYLDAGAQNCILGTMAVTRPDEVMAMVEKYTTGVSIGIDAKNGYVAVQGWTESTQLRAAEVAARYDALHPFSFIYTDIERDGMMKGPNIPATLEFAQSVASEVILSGGVTTIQDVRDALPLKAHGVSGIIIGRALYEKTIDFKEAAELVAHV